MKNVFNYSDSLELNRESANTVIVKSAEEIMALRRVYPNEDIRVRLVLAELDADLIDMLISLETPFDIVLQSDKLRENTMMELRRFKHMTNNKAFIAYNIDNKSLFERTELIYYIDKYDVTALLSSKNQKLLSSWIEEIRKYTKRNNVKKLNKSYIGNE